MADDANDWQSSIHRANVVANIEEAVRRAGNPPIARSPADMENAIFMQSKAKDDYKARISRVIMHLQEASNRAGGQFSGAHATTRVVPQAIQQPAQIITAGSVPMTMPRQPMIISQMVRQPVSSAVPTSVSPYTMANMTEVSRVSPAPGVAGPAPSPGSGAQVITTQRYNAPSPGNAIMPTSAPTVDPMTVQPSASPALQGNTTAADEDRLYAEKLSELQIYVEPLRGMLTKLSEQQERQKDLAKLTSLLKILTSTSRTTLSNLSKCEGVLKKMNILPPAQAAKMSQQHASVSLAVNAPATTVVATASTTWTATTASPAVPSTVSATVTNAVGGSTVSLQSVSGAPPSGAGSVPSSAGAPSGHAALAASIPSAAPAAPTVPAAAAGPTGVSAPAAAAAAMQQQQAPSEQHWCQPLLNAVAESIKSPMFSEALQLTFGPVVTALRGVVNRRSSPFQYQGNESNSVYLVPRAVQGELARLQPRFRVRLDQAYHGSDFAQQLKIIHLTCSLEDENLPTVPQLRFMLPDGYPHCNPSVDIESLEVYYGSSPFFKDVKQRLLSNLSALQGNYSMTALLHAWCMSIRQAIRPVE